MPRSRAAALVMVGSALLAAGGTGHAAPTASAEPGATAPGVVSHFGLARKDCLGTARGKASKTWFTVAGGVLSDVYYPTVDNTEVQTLQYVVTDGRSFTDLHRDTTFTVAALDPSGMSCRVTSTANSGRYTITTDYFTDPFRASVVMRIRLVPAPGAGELALYARFDPTVNGNGGGGDGNGGADDAETDRSTGQAVPVTSDTACRPPPPTATTTSRSTPPCRPTGRSGRCPAATPARRATASPNWTRTAAWRGRTTAPRTETSCTPRSSTPEPAARSSWRWASAPAARRRSPPPGPAPAPTSPSCWTATPAAGDATTRR